LETGTKTIFGRSLELDGQPDLARPSLALSNRSFTPKESVGAEGVFIRRSIAAGRVEIVGLAILVRTENLDGKRARFTSGARIGDFDVSGEQREIVIWVWTAYGTFRDGFGTIGVRIQLYAGADEH